MAQKPTKFTELVAVAVRAALDAILAAGKKAYEDLPAGEFSIGKKSDVHLYGDKIAERAMFDVVHDWARANDYCVLWWSEELGKLICGNLDSTYHLTVTADGIDGTNPFKGGKESGPIITVARGKHPKYKAIEAAAIGLVKMDEVYVADPFVHEIYLYSHGEFSSKTRNGSHPTTDKCLIDTYTAVAKAQHVRASKPEFHTTGATGYSIYLVAFQGYGLLLDGTDKLMFEQHAMYAFAEAAGCILETYALRVPFDEYPMLEWQMKPDPASDEQLTFYFVPNQSFKDYAIQMFG